MKTKLFDTLQRIGRSFMLPIAILPIAGLFLGIGSCMSNETVIVALHMENILAEGTLLHILFMIMGKVGSAIFTNLPIIFAASVALGMARKEKEVAVLSAIIAFFVMHTTINGMLVANAQIIDNQIAPGVLAGTIVNVCGILSLEMGVFGGILVGLGVSILHNKFHRIELPSILSFFEGSRFVPIISAITFLGVGFLMYFLWPFLQHGIFVLGDYISRSGYVGTFVYGITKRVLVPFGLHHVFYLPFWQTGIGGAMEIQNVMVYGGQNIFFAQLADPSVTHFSSDATRFFTGEYIFMMFGLPGAALAMYRCARSEHKKVVGSLLVSAALTSILTGITEPMEFTFLFAAPLLFGVQVLLAGSAYMIAHILNIAVGVTFSGGLIDFFIFGVLQGNAKTSWMLLIPIGIIYFFVYYVIFKFLIVKFDLKTPGRDIEHDVSIFTKKKKDRDRELLLQQDDYVVDEQAKMIVSGLGGRANFCDLDTCITRIRATIVDNELVNQGILKQAGAAAIVMHGSGIQIIFGPKASYIKTNIDEYLSHVVDDEVDQCSFKKDSKIVTLCSVVKGEVMPIEESCDAMFTHKLLGDGVMIKANDGLVVAPVDGVVSMVYPNKHSITLTLDSGVEVQLHLCSDTANLNDNGFALFVDVKQRVNKGDLLWNGDLTSIEKHSNSVNIIMVITKMPKHAKIEKIYGTIDRGEVIMKLYE